VTVNLLHQWWLDIIHLPYREILAAAPDVLVVAMLVYYVLMLAKGTRAWQVLWGLLAFAAIYGISNWLNLLTLSFILEKIFFLGPVALVILSFRKCGMRLKKSADLVSGAAALSASAMKICLIWSDISFAPQAYLRAGEPAL